MSPEVSDDLTIVVEEVPDGTFALLLSPDTAEHQPDYIEVHRFPTREAAERAGRA
jgi:hypothetical protein